MNHPLKFYDSQVIQLFTFRRTSTIKSFFTSQFVDVPVCFKKSKSLYSQTFEVPMEKLINLFTRDGKKQRALHSLTYSFSQLITKLKPLTNSQANKNLLLTHLLIDSVVVSSGGYFRDNGVSEGGVYTLSEAEGVDSSRFSLKTKDLVLSSLMENLRKRTPIFSFYIRKVDKKTRKNSRGKSGKYMIIWKYVPIYKRLYVSMR